MNFSLYAARRRADHLVEQFALAGAANQRAGRYSGGMRRRLDLAASLILNPAALFLEEPNTRMRGTRRRFQSTHLTCAV